MKRLTILFVAALFASQTAGAQSLDALLRLFGLGGSQEKTEQKAEEPAAPALTADGLTGVWHYIEPASRYDGNDILGSIGIKAVEEMLPSMYAKAGLADGKGTMTFTAPDTASGQLGGYNVSGRYEFAPEDGSLTLSARIGGTSGVLHGSATLDGEVLTLLFDAAEAAAIVERVSSKAATNDNFKMMKSLLDKYPGVKLGCRMKR